MKALLLLFLTLSFSVRAYELSNINELLDTLDAKIEERDRILSERKANITRLQSTLGTDTSFNAGVYLDIAESFRTVNVDSALSYYELARSSAEMSGRSDIHFRATLRRDGILPLAGISKEAIDEYLSLPIPSDTAGRAAYFREGAFMYMNILQLNRATRAASSYRKKANQRIDSLLKYLPPESLERKISRTKIKQDEGNKTMALAEMSELLPQAKADPLMFSYVTRLLADYYAGNPDFKDDYLKYLVLTATAEAQYGYANLSTLPFISEELMARDEWKKSFAYMQTSLRDAARSGSQSALMASGEKLPDINEKFHERNHSYFVWLSIAASVLFVALIAILVLCLKIDRDRKQQKAMQLKLQETNEAKDIYIRNILSLCSGCMERLEDFNRHVGRKIKAGQVQDLFSSIESGKYIQQQTEQFYTNFDEAFLFIFPNFIRDVNTLLQPGKEYKDVNRRTLTPELRILAFMRLGVDESAKVAQFLGLSVNTIYTYRNRMKTRASNRETFEENVKKIGNNA